MTSPRRRAFPGFSHHRRAGAAVRGVAGAQAHDLSRSRHGLCQRHRRSRDPARRRRAEGFRALGEAGLIERPAFFRLYAGQRGAASRFRPGHYKIQAPITPRQLVDLIVKGVADELVAVTLPEGKNMIEVAEILDAAGVASKAELLAQAMDPIFVKSLDLPGRSLEGYLFPDTYKLRPHSQASRVLVALVRRHRQVFDELRAANPTGANYLKTKLKFDDAAVVTLASIVEKETGQPEERPRIAQVFINRLVKPSFRPSCCKPIRPSSTAAPWRRCSWARRPPPARNGTAASTASTSTIRPTRTTRTPTRACPRPHRQPRPRGPGRRVPPDGTQLPLLRRQERRHPPVLGHHRRARSRRGQVPARRQGPDQGRRIGKLTLRAAKRRKETGCPSKPVRRAWEQKSVRLRPA
jgi:hypothetical protein